VFLGCYWIGRFAVLHRRHPLWGLLFLAVPAVLVSIDRMTVDVALAAGSLRDLPGVVLHPYAYPWGPVKNAPAISADLLALAGCLAAIGLAFLAVRSLERRARSDLAPVLLVLPRIGMQVFPQVVAVVRGLVL
jgi:hypothetical protein